MRVHNRRCAPITLGAPSAQNMSDPTNAVPPGWGDDELTKFIELARQHAFGTFRNLKDETASISAIDATFIALIEGWMNLGNPIVAGLAVRSFSAFRAAIQLAMSGQLAEAYMVMRGCLEHALYGNYIDLNPASWEIWSQRRKSDEARKLCVKTFAGRNIFAAIRGRSSVVGEIAGGLYERTIDFGAHPNEMAVGTSMEVTEQADGGLVFGYSYLSGDGLPLRLCLKSAAQTGLIVLDIFTLVFPERSAETAIQARLAPIKRFY
ncbi:MAG: hypothetical protein JWM95_378 [Gemmatimonadetes bacterium]|nr:hypothetical protein [Gemmatimonadota bacterium]